MPRYFLGLYDVVIIHFQIIFVMPLKEGTIRILQTKSPVASRVQTTVWTNGVRYQAEIFLFKRRFQTVQPPNRCVPRSCDWEQTGWDYQWSKLHLQDESLPFMELEVSLEFSQDPASDLYIQPAKSTPYLTNLSYNANFNINFRSPTSASRYFRQLFCTRISIAQCMLYCLPISSSYKLQLCNAKIKESVYSL